MRLELTRRGDYAVRAMLALAAAAAAADERPVSVRRIAETMAIPAQILPSVVRELVRAGLLDVVPGRSGGYRLARPAREISLLSVIEAIEGESRRQTCVLRGGPCGRDGHCNVHNAFFAAQEAIRTELRSATLDQLGEGISPP
jgi:Rrf2 family iron-sulfur cluster assembly transcriptional regulator